MERYPFLIVLFFLFGMLFSCRRPMKEAPTLKTVKIDTVRIDESQMILQYPGKVKAVQDINLAFRVSGTIRNIMVRDGQQVKSGQLLAELDPTDYQVQLAATEAQYQQTKNEAERVIALYKDGGSTPVAYDKALYGLKQITALYEHHKDELSYTKLYAPFNGYIQKHFFESHEVVGAGMPVLSMVGEGVPEVEINLPAVEYIRCEQFYDYNCSFDVYPNKIYRLKPIGITHKANSNQLYAMRFQLLIDSNPMPSAGMNTMVNIKLKEDSLSRLEVASSALKQANGRLGVLVYNPQTTTVHFCEVDLVRLTKDGNAIITSLDLKPGFVVVSAGVYSVRDGEKVRLLPPQSLTNVGGML